MNDITGKKVMAEENVCIPTICPRIQSDHQKYGKPSHELGTLTMEGQFKVVLGMICFNENVLYFFWASLFSYLCFQDSYIN